MDINRIKVIAFYLPQFHPFPENDKWWGKGFTEWTNVGKAKPLFRGHDQPRVPTELGYYDLRLPIIREEQAQMARDAGVNAFCYWHYWFGNGKTLLADIFNDVLKTGKPEFPFCLGWANHSWSAKTWNADGATSERLLVEQTYPGIEDAKMHFGYLLKAFNDERYLKIDGKPFLFIFDPSSLPLEYVQNFKKWTTEAGFKGLFLVGNIRNRFIIKDDLLENGYDAVTYQRLGGNPFSMNKIQRSILTGWKLLKGCFLHRPPYMVDYKKYYEQLVTDEELQNRVLPTILPQWDHTPRSGWNGTLMVNSTPDLFYKLVKKALLAVRYKPDEYKIILLKSWNEWGEGNFMEPDMTYGRGFIDALRKAINEYTDI